MKSESIRTLKCVNLSERLVLVISVYDHPVQSNTRSRKLTGFITVQTGISHFNSPTS